MKTDQDRVWFTYGETVNVGDYNSFKVGGGYETNVLPSETSEQALARITLVVKKHVRTQKKIAIAKLLPE